MHDYFSYNDGAGIVPEGHFRISPSQLSRFFDNTSDWYREFLLGEDAKFQGNTMSNLGTCVHAGAEMFVNEGSIDTTQIDAYISSIYNPEVDQIFITEQYQPMLDALVNQYLSFNMPSKTELFLYKEIIPSIGIGGSIDSIINSTIVDYKTTSALTPPKKLSRAYYFQQMAYVWLARMNGYNIDTIRLVFITTQEVNRISEKTGKPMKDYPATVSLVEHLVTDQDIDIIESVIKLVADSVKAWQDNPDIRYLLAQDFRLKPAPVLKLFKDK